MSALCGAFAWKGQGPLSLELTAVQACLAPYGEPRKAAAERGAWSVALAAHQNQPEFRRGPALVERANPYFMVAADVRIEHRRELCAALSTSSASSDAELILRAYERWGTSLIDHLRGQFAFAIFDG